MGELEILKFLVENGCSLQETNRNGTCIMNAAENSHTELVIWMLSNGSSIDENYGIDSFGNTTTLSESCEDILKRNGIYTAVKRAFTTKSSRK